MIDFNFTFDKFINMVLSMKKIERLRSICRYLCPKMSMNVDVLLREANIY